MGLRYRWDKVRRRICWPFLVGDACSASSSERWKVRGVERGRTIEGDENKRKLKKDEGWNEDDKKHGEGMTPDDQPPSCLCDFPNEARGRGGPARYEKRWVSGFGLETTVPLGVRI